MREFNEKSLDGSNTLDGDIIISGNIEASSFETDELGINTSEVPHGGIGSAQLAIEGSDGSTSGPHVQFTTDADNYPLLQILPYEHNNTYLAFDAFFDGAWKSSSASSRHGAIFQNGDGLNILTANNINAGSALTWTTNTTWTNTLTTHQIPVIIDATSQEAFLIRKDSDGGDILVVDTDNEDIEAFCPLKLSKELQFTGADTENYIEVPGSQTDGFRIKTSTNEYLSINSNTYTTSLIGNTVDITATNFNITATSDFTGNVSIDDMKLADSTLTFSGGNGTNIISIPDNLADAFSIQENTNKYITFDTTNNAESIDLLQDTSITGSLSVSQQLDQNGFIYTSGFQSVDTSWISATIETCLWGALTHEGEPSSERITYSSGVFTVNRSGKYLITRSESWQPDGASAVDDQMLSYITVNALSARHGLVRQVLCSTNTANVYEMSASCILDLNDGDTFRVNRYQDTGSNATWGSSISDANGKIQIAKIG